MRGRTYPQGASRPCRAYDSLSLFVCVFLFYFFDTIASMRDLHVRRRTVRNVRRSSAYAD